ncbi:MAG: hypothetical protein AAB766_00875 [Patescibacteria group bacterium]
MRKSILHAHLEKFVLAEIVLTVVMTTVHRLVAKSAWTAIVFILAEIIMVIRVLNGVMNNLASVTTTLANPVPTNAVPVRMAVIQAGQKSGRANLTTAMVVIIKSMFRAE